MDDPKHLVSEISDNIKRAGTRLPSWVKVGAFAAASALAGGLAATWFYRKTLTRVQNAESEPENSNFRIQNRSVDGDY
ncbi:hypothetical protein [Occallatibacter riparius]|uniref:Uncharacterized protein n=1 Tax=Occallatibacter riparius TaxID=1002689 RepID=A0A9J7BWE5_9BACT|nr:hypothetical protein [Occallatibacter riparius]UWZ86960.1 hypothetical protein MOP44_13655 [Occallatibacter riparius]